MSIEQAFEQAQRQHRAGHLEQAKALYRQILSEAPQHADSLHYLGVLAHQTARHEEAVELIKKAIDLKPDFPAAYSNLGQALKECGRLEEAIAAYRRAIALKPASPEAFNNLGNALKDAGQADEAITAFRQAIALKPDFHHAHGNLGNALRDMGQLDDAIAAYRHAIAIQPGYATAHSNLGNALSDRGNLDEAIHAYRRAISINPGFHQAHSNLGNALKEQGQLNEAIAAYREAIRLAPDYAEAHNNLAHALLLQGNLPEGWEEKEWRWKCRDFSSPRRNFRRPQWDGGALQGRTLLLHAEQGCGDAIQSIRYLPLTLQRGARVIIECQPELQRLFQTMADRLPVIARGQPIPDFDVHCPMLSLPRLFSTDLNSIPRNVPYLSANSAAAMRWQPRLADRFAAINVGLVWAGNPAHKNDHNRSVKLLALAPLANIPGARFVSLQKGDASIQARTPPPGMDLFDPAQELTDFADTAALIAALDLVITVDTSVAHLAGAMGKPVWMLVPFAPDWRWMLGRNDSPWYPDMRLFRQSRIGDWPAVIAEVCDQLQALMLSRSHHASVQPASDPKSPIRNSEL